MAWWNNDWDYRLRVKVNSDHVDSNLTDVPLWVRLRDGNFDFTKTTTIGGAEIRFVDYNNIQIPHEITQWNTASGIADIWVKFPEVSSTEDSYVWMYYGNPTASGMADVKGLINNLEEDEFPGTTLSGIWTWDAGTGGSYTVSGSNLYINSGSGASASDPTWVYQSVGANEDFDVTCKVYAPDIDANYEHTGLLVWIDTNNWAKIIRLYSSGAGGQVIESYHNEAASPGVERTAFSNTTTYLRMRRINGAITCWYSDTGDDDDWTHFDPAARLETDAAVSVGLLASHQSGSQFVAAFDWFRFKTRPYGSQVWTDYDLVYHLNDETMDGTVEQVIDSSPALNHGTSSGNPTPGQTGIVNKSKKNDGSDYIASVGYAGILGSDDRTTLLWFKPTQAAQGTYAGMFSYGASGANNSWFMQSGSAAEDYYGFDLWGNLTTTWLAVDPADGWHYWAVKWDGSSWKAYMDAGLVMDRSASPSTVVSSYYVGQNYYDVVSCLGYIDEVRVYREVLDADEIKVQYLNMGDHSKIMSYDEPDYEGLYPEWLGTWGQRIKLTIDHTKVDETLENFPTMVRVSDSSGLTNADITAFFDELTLSGTAGYEDDFTGTNGDPPDSYKWQTSGSPQIQNNRLRMDASGTSEWARTNYDFYGNFDVQVDFENMVVENFVGFTMELRANAVSDGTGYYVNIRRAYDAGQKYRSQSWDGSLHTLTTTSTADLSGKMRMTRDGTTVKTYYWNSGWVEHAEDTFDVLGSNPIRIMFFTSSYSGNPNVQVDWDNFTINSGSIYDNTQRKRVAFTTWNGTQQFPAEIELFDTANEDAVYWVNVPQISSEDDTILYLYYDSSQPNNTDYVGDVGSFAATKVWDEDFEIVCHMANSPTGSANDMKNSAKGWHGTTYNMGSGNLGASSLGRYITFDGAAEFIDFGDVFYTNELTVETIANVTSFTGGQPRTMVVKRNTVGTANTLDAEWSFHFTNATYLALAGWNFPVNCGASGAPNFEGTEYYVAATTGALEGDVIKLYINDTDHGTCARTAGTILNTASAWQIGARTNNNSSRYFYGSIREVRVSTIVRTAEWTKATYYTSWDDLISYSAPENDEVFRFQGTVLVEGSPASRTVYLYRRDTGELVREVTSNEIDGLFEAGSPNWDYHFCVILPELDDTYDLIADDKIHPGN